MQELVGKIIKEIRINKQHTVITFFTNDNQAIQYFAYGDCCSRSWIEHVNGVDEFIGQEIESVEEVTALSNIEGMLTSRGKSDMMKVYFYRIKTKSGWNPVHRSKK